MLLALLGSGKERGDRDRKQDADDEQDDKELDQSETLVDGR